MNRPRQNAAYCSLEVYIIHSHTKKSLKCSSLSHKVTILLILFLLSWQCHFRTSTLGKDYKSSYSCYSNLMKSCHFSMDLLSSALCKISMDMLKQGIPVQSISHHHWSMCPARSHLSLQGCLHWGSLAVLYQVLELIPNALLRHHCLLLLLVLSLRRKAQNRLKPWQLCHTWGHDTVTCSAICA